MLDWDILFTDVHLASMAKGESNYGIIKNAALAIKNGSIAWVGKADDIPDGADPMITRHMDNVWLTPGLIDCHTHMIFGGNRSGEFEQRLKGATYEEIAKAGGGIQSTVKATREASEEELFINTYPYIGEAKRQGITTLEIKSGYGLTLEDELKMLRVAKRIDETLDIDVASTCLAAHTIPEEYKNDPDAYVNLVVREIIPAVAKEGLADTVDAFMEHIAFSAAHIIRIFEAAREHHLSIKLHADQLSNMSGAGIAADYGALSADHLEYSSDTSIAAMSKAGTVAVLLPGAYYNLKADQKPPVDSLRKHGVPIALATDFNPGSSPSNNLQLMLHMGCTLFDLTPEEALAGVTRNAAIALGLNDRGTLEVGKLAHLAFWNVDHPSELSYWFGRNLLVERYY